MAVLLAVGTTALSSSDFTLTGETSTLFLVNTTSPLNEGAQAVIEMKSTAGQYYVVGALSATRNPALAITAPGTYRVTRYAGASCGVDRV